MVVDSFVSIREDILRIRQASAARDSWAVLGIPPKSAYKQIKSAQRKWIRKLHPDRWYAIADEHLREEILEAYYQVQVAYFEALKHCVSAHHTAHRHGPIVMPPPSNGFGHKRLLAWLRRLLEKMSRAARASEAGCGSRS